MLEARLYPDKFPPDEIELTTEEQSEIEANVVAEYADEAYDESYQRTRLDKRHEILTGRAYNKHFHSGYTSAIGDLTKLIALRHDNPHESRHHSDP